MAGLRPRGAQCTGSRPSGRQPDFVCGILRTDARRCNAGFARFCGASSAHLVRCPYGGAVPGTDPSSRRGPVDSAYLQPGASEFYFDQVFVGAPKRAGKLAPRSFSHASQGLCPVPDDRRAGDRYGGCFRNSSPGCRKATLVLRNDSVRGNRGVDTPPIVRVPGNLRESDRCRRVRYGIESRNSGCGRRRGSGCRRNRDGDRRARRRQCNHRDFRRCICRHRQAGAGFKGAPAHVLSRSAGTLARDGCDPGRRTFVEMVSRPFRRRSRR